jgi:hypothetical protein
MLPDLVGSLLNIDLSETVTRTACFNGVEDGSAAPYEDPDLYIMFENDVRVFVYGETPIGNAVPLRENEYVLVIPKDSFPERQS